jgi:uncharacterized protein
MTQLIIEKPTIITLKVQVLPEQAAAFAAWQAKMNREIAGCPGFISLEFVSPTPSQKDWLIVQRFGNKGQASFWQSSATYQEIKDDLKQCSIPNTINEEIAADVALGNGVTEVIVAEVFPSKEEEYREWSAKIHLEEAKCPGFRGVYVQSPVEHKGKFWITLLQFDTMEHLDRWLNSAERQNLLNDSKSMISYLETHRIISPYAGWFASIAKVGEIPALWKQTMIVLLVLFPIVMLELKYLNPLLTGLNISLGTFIGNAVSVTLISFPMMPVAIYFLKWWLLPSQKQRIFAIIAGTLTVIALYLIEIWLFWSFL